MILIFSVNNVIITIEFNDDDETTGLYHTTEQPSTRGMFHSISKMCMGLTGVKV